MNRVSPFYPHGTPIRWARQAGSGSTVERAPLSGTRDGQTHRPPPKPGELGARCRGRLPQPGDGS